MSRPGSKTVLALLATGLFLLRAFGQDKTTVVGSSITSGPCSAASVGSRVVNQSTCIFITTQDGRNVKLTVDIRLTPKQMDILVQQITTQVVARLFNMLNGQQPELARNPEEHEEKNPSPGGESLIAATSAPATPAADTTQSIGDAPRTISGTVAVSGSIQTASLVEPVGDARTVIGSEPGSTALPIWMQQQIANVIDSKPLDGAGTLYSVLPQSSMAGISSANSLASAGLFPGNVTSDQLAVGAPLYTSLPTQAFGVGSAEALIKIDTQSVQQTAFALLAGAGNSNQSASLVGSGGLVQFGADGSMSLTIQGASADHLPIELYDPRSSYATAIGSGVGEYSTLALQTTTISLASDGTVRFDGLALKAGNQTTFSAALVGLSAGVGNTYGVGSTSVSEPANWSPFTIPAGYTQPKVELSCGFNSSLIVDSEGVVRPCTSTWPTTSAPTKPTDIN